MSHIMILSSVTIAWNFMPWIIRPMSCDASLALQIAVNIRAQDRQ
ncbi:hypothetical protein [Mesorhizobium caraganae]